MPPPMSAHDYDTPDLTKEELDDKVIETVYDIVRRAESSSHKPSRAVLTAYNDYLREQGLLPSDDAILHRFLFRIQQDERKGENLIERFQRVLHESFGIDVDVNEDGEGIEVTTELDATRNRAQIAAGQHSRRGSFDSFFDGTADKVAGTDYGDLPIRARRRSRQGSLNGRYDRSNRRRTQSDTEAHSYQQAQLPIRTRSNGNTHRRTTSTQQQHTRKRSTSVSSRGSLQIRRYGSLARPEAGDNDEVESEYTDRTTSLDLSHVQIPGVNAPIPDDQSLSLRVNQQYLPEPWQPSDTRLMDEAEAFEQQRLHRVTRACIHAWRNRMQEVVVKHENMERQAIAHDRRILLSLSFDQLRDTARVKRASQETDRFFSRLESRADKARNLFLLTKAFTHWARSAEDEVQRTSVARRHILRTRFFNGWRDITAVNELKIQQFVIGKFLRQWRARTAVIRENNRLSISIYEENLVRRIYKEWFFKFCAVAAPAWRNDRIRRVTLQKWNEIATVLRERENWAVDRRDHMILRHSFQNWHHKTTTVRAQQPLAGSSRRTALLTIAFRTLQKQAQLAPLLRQFQERVNQRILRTAVGTWQSNSQASRQARSVDRMRILRNAWTAWNDGLRIKALEDQINDRILVECLYKWTLASRVSLFQRVHDRQLKEYSFLTWVTKTNQRTNTLEAAEQRFAQFKRSQLLRTALRRLEAVTTEKRREEFAVVAEFQQKLKQRIFDKLMEKHEHFQQLKQWSGDARFYVLSKRTLKIWSEATQHARRNRRRETYAQVRRTSKLNLVRKYFENWRDRSNHVTVLNQQANDTLENRIIQNAGALLQQWRDRTALRRQQDAQATNIHNSSIMTRHFHTWSSHVELLHTLEHQAVALRQESAEIAATSALKKLSWRLWNVQQQKKNARALHERTFEKHVRAMMRFWFEQTADKLANRPVSPTPTSRSRGGRKDRDDQDSNPNGHRDATGNLEQGDEGGVPDNADDETHNLGPWTAFDETALGLNDLDLSLSATPDFQRSTTNPYAIPPSSSTHPPPQPQPSFLARPRTYPQPNSALRPPLTIPEYPNPDLDDDFADPSTFWSGTPRPPPPTTSSKPGYLKTPSKRSVARAKRPGLPASPEKRVLSPVRRPLGLDAGRRLLERERGGGVGSMSAPPTRMARDVRLEGEVTSFERRLREGGFGRSVAGSGSVVVRGREGARGKGRVGFEEVGERE